MALWAANDASDMHLVAAQRQDISPDVPFKATVVAGRGNVRVWSGVAFKDGVVWVGQAPMCRALRPGVPYAHLNIRCGRYV